MNHSPTAKPANHRLNHRHTGTQTAIIREPKPSYRRTTVIPANHRHTGESRRYACGGPVSINSAHRHPRVEPAFPGLRLKACPALDTGPAPHSIRGLPRTRYGAGMTGRTWNRLGRTEPLPASVPGRSLPAAEIIEPPRPNDTDPLPLISTHLYHSTMQQYATARVQPVAQPHAGPFDYPRAPM